MPGRTDNIGSAQAFAGTHDEDILDFRKEYPGLHLVIVSKKASMRHGQSTQYEYFTALGLTELRQLPHPDKVLMGEPMEQYKRRKQKAIDLDRMQKKSTGVKKEKGEQILVTSRPVSDES